MADNTVFDSVFKTMVQKEPRLLIPFVNEVFCRNYPQDAQIVRFSDEHEGVRGTVIDDTVFRLQDKIYHVECQSTADSAMVIRMIEYDFPIALESALDAGAPYGMEFPASCVLFLRHGKNTPDELSIKVKLPSGDSFDYVTKVVKAQSYSSQQLVAKRLLILVPYYLMRYEQDIPQIANDPMLADQLIAKCSELRGELESLTVKSGDTVLYEELVELIIKVSDHLFASTEALRKRVRKAMGGEVLELMRERAARLEREAETRGIELGIEQGIEQGQERGIKTLSEELRAQGVDGALIEAAIATIRARSQESTSKKDAPEEA